MNDDTRSLYRILKDGEPKRRAVEQRLGAAPNFSKAALPHAQTFAGRISGLSKAYLPADEALRDSIRNARIMRNDCGIMECVEARQRSLSLLPWHLEVENEKSQLQRQLKERLTAVVRRTNRFTGYLYSASHAVWYGRSGVAHVFAPTQIDGRDRIYLQKHWHVNGDKLVFPTDDGSMDYPDDTVGIRVRMDSQAKGMQRLNRRKMRQTTYGWVYWLDRDERDLLTVHKHLCEDGDYDDIFSAGSIHGVGIRSRIYQTWFQMVECLAWLMDYLERTALGIMIWPYPAGDDGAKLEVEKAAHDYVSNGRTSIFVPIVNGDLGARDWAPIPIEPGTQGAQTLIDIIKTFFYHKIKRYILGQTLTSEAEATGLGGGVADAHVATYADIVRFDARNLEETVTEDLIEPLKRLNFPRAEGVHVRFVIDTESPDVSQKLDAIFKTYQMGLKIKADDLYTMASISKPDDGDDVLQQPQGMPGMGADPNGAMQFGGIGSNIPARNAQPQSMKSQMLQQALKALAA